MAHIAKWTHTVTVCSTCSLDLQHGYHDGKRMTISDCTYDVLWCQLRTKNKNSKFKIDNSTACRKCLNCLPMPYTVTNRNFLSQLPWWLHDSLQRWTKNNHTQIKHKPTSVILDTTKKVSNLSPTVDQLLGFLKENFGGWNCGVAPTLLRLHQCKRRALVWMLCSFAATHLQHNEA